VLSSAESRSLAGGHGMAVQRPAPPNARPPSTYHPTPSSTRHPFTHTRTHTHLQERDQIQQGGVLGGSLRLRVPLFELQSVLWLEGVRVRVGCGRGGRDGGGKTLLKCPCERSVLTAVYNPFPTLTHSHPLPQPQPQPTPTPTPTPTNNQPRSSSPPPHLR